MRTYPASSLENRLVRLEKRNRVLGWLWLATAVLLLAALTVPQLAREVVRAERYQLTDPSGMVRAELRLDAGAATLELLDESGNVQATLSQAAAGAPDVWIAGRSTAAHGGAGGP